MRPQPVIVNCGHLVTTAGTRSASRRKAQVAWPAGKMELLAADEANRVAIDKKVTAVTAFVRKISH